MIMSKIFSPLKVWMVICNPSHLFSQLVQVFQIQVIWSASSIFTVFNAVWFALDEAGHFCAGTKFTVWQDCASVAPIVPDQAVW